MTTPSVFVHASSFVDEGCEIGEGTKIWHFCHVMPRARIGRGCNIGQNVVISPDVVIGDNVRIQNNVSVYTGVIAGRRCVLRPVDGVHERRESAEPRVAQGRVPAHPRRTRGEPRRELHRGLRPCNRAVCLRRGRRRGDTRRSRLRAGRRQPGPRQRLDVRMRRQAGDGKYAAGLATVCQACGKAYRVAGSTLTREGE